MKYILDIMRIFLLRNAIIRYNESCGPDSKEGLKGWKMAKTESRVNDKVGVVQGSCVLFSLFMFQFITQAEY